MDSRPARPQTIRLAAGHQTLRLPPARSGRRPERGGHPHARKQLLRDAEGEQAHGRAARPSADRLLPHPAALRRQRPGDRLPLPLGQPDGAADSGRRRRRLPRQDGPRNRPPRRPAYRRAGGHRAGRLQDGPVACRQDRPLLPQFSLQHPQRRDGNRHPDPRHHGRRHGASGARRKGETAAQRHSERPDRHRDIRPHRASGGHQRPRSGNVRRNRSGRYPGTQHFRQPQLLGRDQGLHPRRPGYGLHHTLRFFESPKLLRHQPERLHRLDGPHPVSLQRHGRNHPLPAHQHRQHGTPPDAGPAHGIRSAVPSHLRIRAGGIHQLQPLQQKRVMRRASGCATTANPIRPTSATSSENTAASTPTTARNCCTGWRSSSPGRYSRHRSPAASCTTTAGRHGSRATSSAATTGRRSR